MESAKIGFFSRVKKAIFKFDEYEKFIKEPLKKAFSYFFKLVIIFSFVITISLVYILNNYTEEFLKVFKEEFPKFTISNNELVIEGKDEFTYYFEDLNFQVVMNKNETADIKTDYDNSLILLKNKMIIKFGNLSQNIYYQDGELNGITNENISQILGAQNKTILLVTLAMTMFVTNFMTYTIILLLDILTLSILGLIINILIKTAFKFADIFKISIYAMTLPIILYLIYSVANVVLGTTIKYFDLAYNAISYIYLITVLLIMKSDIIKNMQELQTVLEEQKKVKEEIKKEKQEEKEREEEKEKEGKDKKDGENKEESPQDPQPDNG